MAESSATCRIVLATMGATDMRWILGAAIVIATSLPVALGSAVTSDARKHIKKIAIASDPIVSTERTGCANRFLKTRRSMVSE